VLPYQDVTVLARHAVSDARPPMRPASGLATCSIIDDDRQRQTPASETILAY